METEKAWDNSTEGLQRQEEATQPQSQDRQAPYRQWWKTVGSSHPNFEGVPGDWFEQDILRYVTPHPWVSTSIHTRANIFLQTSKYLDISNET